LKILGVELGRSWHISRDQCTKSLALRRSKELYIPIIASWTLL